MATMVRPKKAKKKVIERRLVEADEGGERSITSASIAR